MDIRKFARVSQFSLELKSLGRIRCLPLTTGLMSEAMKRINASDFRCEDFVRWLLGEMARWPGNENFQDDDPIDGDTLKPKEMAAVSVEDLNVFAEAVVRNNKLLTQTHEGKDLEKLEDQTACEFLVNVFRHYEAEGKKRWDLFSKSATQSLFANSTLDSIKRSLDASDQLQNSIEKYAGISSVFNSELKAEMANPRHLEVTLPPIPKNPIHETNQILEDLATQIQDMRPLIAQGAEFIRSMNDTALRMQADYIGNAAKTERQTKLAIWIAVVSLVISSIFSYLNYVDSKEVDKKNKEQIAAFQQALEKLVREQKEEMSILAKSIAAEPSPRRLSNVK